MTKSDDKSFRLADLPGRIFGICLPLLITFTAIASTQEPVKNFAQPPLHIKILSYGLLSLIILTIFSGVFLLFQSIFHDSEPPSPEEQWRAEHHTLTEDQDDKGFRLADLPETLFHLSIMPVLLLALAMGTIEGPGAADLQVQMLKWLGFALIPVVCTGSICLLQRVLNGPKPNPIKTKKESPEEKRSWAFERAMATIFIPVSCFMVTGAVAKDQGTLGDGYVDIGGLRFSLWPFIALMVIGYIDLFFQIFKDFVSEQKKLPDKDRKIALRWDGES